MAACFFRRACRLLLSRRSRQSTSAVAMACIIHANSGTMAKGSKRTAISCSVYSPSSACNTGIAQPAHGTRSRSAYPKQARFHRFRNCFRRSMRSCTYQQSKLEAHQAFFVDATWFASASAGPLWVVISIVSCSCAPPRRWILLRSVPRRVRSLRSRDRTSTQHLAGAMQRLPWRVWHVVAVDGVGDRSNGTWAGAHGWVGKGEEVTTKGPGEKARGRWVGFTTCLERCEMERV